MKTTSQTLVISNTNITNEATPTKLTAAAAAKKVFIKARGANSFLFSSVVAGTPYYSVPSGGVLEIDTQFGYGDTVGYAKSGVASDVIEMLFIVDPT